MTARFDLAHTGRLFTHKRSTALLLLPGLARLKIDDGALTVTVGWIEAKEAGGFTKLKGMNYAVAPMDDEVRSNVS